jgi:adenylate cyclase
MSKRWRTFAISAIFVVVSAAGTFLLSRIRFFELLNLKALDAQFVLRGKRPVSNIELIVADEKALNTFTDLRLFWHPYYAEAIRAAGEAGARVVGLDVAFGVPVDKWEPDLDRQLSEAVSSSPIPIVVGFVPPLNNNQATLPVPVNMLAAALGLSGFSNLTADSDGFVRRQELIERSSSSESSAHSFALLIAEKFAGRDMSQAFPVPSNRSILINYSGPSSTFPRISLADVIAASRAGRKDQLRDWLGGKIILIGADTVDDRYATPFYTVFAGQNWLTAGVEIHANTVRTLLDHDYLVQAPILGRWTAILAAAAVTITIAISAAGSVVALWVALEVLAILVIGQLLFRVGVILPVLEPLTATAISLVAASIFRFSTAERRGNLFRKAISMFVGQQVAKSLDDTQTIRLSGTRQVVTILFTDIRGFTAYTERMSEEQGPEVVVQVLNEYLAQMVGIIIRHHGHVNKFIGDGILAVFSDSDEGATPDDHPRRAVHCATEIVTAPSQFETGAGIHTGVAVVGNVGSADKMEFTVLGDTVNLASRLESLNKEHHTKLLMSEATEKLLNGVDTLQLGSIAIRGKTVPINVYTLTALMPQTVKTS